MDKLLTVLENDLPQVYLTLGYDEITICVVPRAKAENNYHANQQLFRTSVQTAIKRINGFVDGTNFIQRHTNTKTTHLGDSARNISMMGNNPTLELRKQLVQFHQ